MWSVLPSQCGTIQEAQIWIKQWTNDDCTPCEKFCTFSQWSCIYKLCFLNKVLQSHDKVIIVSVWLLCIVLAGVKFWMTAINICWTCLTGESWQEPHPVFPPAQASPLKLNQRLNHNSNLHSIKVLHLLFNSCWFIIYITSF